VVARERIQGRWREQVLILTELRTPGAGELLNMVATEPRFAGDEIRQAAVWGLGKAGLQQYADLTRFVFDADREVALHAIRVSSDVQKKERTIESQIAILKSLKGLHTI
jgi:hypothetical protein